MCSSAIIQLNSQNRQVDHKSGVPDPQQHYNSWYTLVVPAASDDPDEEYSDPTPIESM